MSRSSDSIEIPAEFEFGYRPDQMVVRMNSRFRVGDGDLVLLVGPNEAGKTTFCKLMSGIIRHSDVNTPGNQPVLVWQDNKLFPQSVEANIEAVCRDEERVARILGRYEFADKANEHAYKLSGGAQKRLAIARAVAARPEAPVVFDEPTRSVDARFFDQVKASIRRVHQSGRTTVVVTHDSRLFSALGDEETEVYSFEPLQRERRHQGAEVQCHGAINALIEEPPSLFTAKFAGHRNIYEISRGNFTHLEEAVRMLRGDWEAIDRTIVIVPERAIHLESVRPKGRHAIEVEAVDREFEGGGRQIVRWRWSPRGGQAPVIFASSDRKGLERNKMYLWIEREKCTFLEPAENGWRRIDLS